MSAIGCLLMFSVAVLIISQVPINPLFFALLILFCSFILAYLMFKMFIVSWMSFVLIMVFSSGMMALFVYVASLLPNEKKKSILTGFLSLVLLISPVNVVVTSQSKAEMKSFAQQGFILLLTGVLVLAMLAISLQSYNPHQALSSTY